MQLDTKQLKKITLLYVEDDEAIRKQTIDLFSKIFKDVIVAQDGKEGLEQFKQNQSIIDIIVTDINMPYKNGLQMVEEINEITNNIPVIITTAHDDGKYIKNAMELNIDKYITKPVQVRELTVSIVELVTKYKRLNNIESLAKSFIEKNNTEASENTQLKEKNQSQEAQLQYYEAIVDNFVLFLETDKTGIITKFSKKFSTFFGFNEDELLGKNINTLKCHSCKGEALQQLMLKSIHLKKTVSSQQTFVTNEDKSYLFEVVLTPQYGSDGLVNSYSFYLDFIST